MKSRPLSLSNGAVIGDIVVIAPNVVVIIVATATV